MSRYFHRTRLVTCYEYYNFTLQHPGISAFFFACQGMEAAIGIFKRFLKANSNCSKEMIEKMFEHDDMTGTAAVYNNIADLKFEQKQALKRMLLIYNINETQWIEKNIENQMSHIMNFFLKVIRNWHSGKPIPSIATKITAGLKASEWELQQEQLRQLMAKDDPNSAYYKDAEHKKNQQQNENDSDFNAIDLSNAKSRYKDLMKKIQSKRKNMKDYLKIAQNAVCKKS